MKKKLEYQRPTASIIKIQQQLLMNPYSSTMPTANFMDDPDFDGE